MNEQYIKEHYGFENVRNVVAKLRDRDGCPWDREQTHESITGCLRDESEEVIEAIENRDYLNLREELGDLLLQVLLHARIAEENGEFTLEDVIDELGHKLVRRHPHVFGDEGQLNDAKAGHTRWNDVKKKEKLDRISEYEQWISDGRLEPQVLDRYKKMLTDKGLL